MASVHTLGEEGSLGLYLGAPVQLGCHMMLGQGGGGMLTAGPGLRPGETMVQEGHSLHVLVSHRLLYSLLVL